jgi:hypothetical protein
MKTLLRTFKPGVFALAVNLLGAGLGVGPAQAASYHLSLPTYQGKPGATVPVPLTLDNAAGLAGITVKINFDPALLSVASVTAGSLGANFTLAQTVENGVATLMFTRSEVLAAGAGRLAVVNFVVNAGAADASLSDLAVAEFSLCDASGVIDLAGGANTLTQTNGKLTVNSFGFVDNNADGIPDGWEAAYGLSLLDNNQLGDADGDGLPNLLEYALGTAPNVANANPQTVGTAVVGGVRFLALTFPKLSGGQTGVSYQVQETANLKDWLAVDLFANTTATQDHGNGVQTVTVKGNLPLSGSGAVPRAFMRVKVTTVLP